MVQAQYGLIKFLDLICYCRSKFGYINLDELSRFLKDIKVLLLEKVYVVNVLGILFTIFYLEVSC